jgi:hypothetical protein
VPLTAPGVIATIVPEIWLRALSFIVHPLHRVGPVYVDRPPIATVHHRVIRGR